MTEGTPFDFDAALAAETRRAAERVTRQIRPRIRLLRDEAAGALVIQNVIGTLRLSASTLLEVRPKVDPDVDWIAAVLDLLISDDRIDIAGERLAGLSPRRPELLEVLASAYATRLANALRREGALSVIQRRSETLGVLKGKLDFSSYVSTATLQPHRFPVNYDELSTDNDFSRGLALVARLLAGVVASSQVRASLIASASALRPGHAEHLQVDPAVIVKPFPPQWAIFRPAWSIAMAILSSSSLLGRSGRQHGLEIAIEPWPLLERLLERSLDEAVRIAELKGTTMQRAMKRPTSLLVDRTMGVVRSVTPDGELTSMGRTLATFEAKYSPRKLNAEWPRRENVFQALSTAAACRSPLAVLVYPEDFEPTRVEVQGFEGYPSQLVTIGLGLYSYRRGVGDRLRGERLLGVLSV